jgi:hypothetical protein
VIVYRQADFATPLRTVPSRRPGRFHRGTEEEPTQYACVHPLGPWAELLRGHDLRTEAQAAAVRARTWALRLEVDDLPEITFDNASDHGIAPRELVANDPRPCWALADRLRAAGAAGAIVPSAALPGTRNIVLFGPRVAAPYLVGPVDLVDVPASVTAEDGRPPGSLLALVRFVGEQHAALRAWRRGREFVFDEPGWELGGASVR